MHWRAMAALAALGLGGLFWIGDLVDYHGRYWPPPKSASNATLVEQAVRKTRSQFEKFPRRGTLGYRDELFVDKEKFAREHGMFFSLHQYALAPVLLDRHGTHPITFVLTRQGFYFEQGKAQP
jgi:hypothetical protein